MDITPGRGSSFSLEILTGYRFLIRSRMFSAEELPLPEPGQSGHEVACMGGFQPVLGARAARAGGDP